MSSGRSYYQRISDLLERTSGGLSGLGRERSGGFPAAAMKRLLIRAVLLLLALTAVVFAGDYLVLRFRVARHGNAFDSVQVQRIYYMLQKNGKTEIIPGEMETQTCVRSLFPHLGYSPCWYARRRSERRVDI
ncbi:MAG: hypothetical protein ABSD88_11670 [Candidatus Korobacteraceae bacterium]|jgi:hypothetical protein